MRIIHLPPSLRYKCYRYKVHYMPLQTQFSFLPPGYHPKCIKFIHILFFFLSSLPCLLSPLCPKSVCTTSSHKIHRFKYLPLVCLNFDEFSNWFLLYMSPCSHWCPITLFDINCISLHLFWTSSWHLVINQYLLKHLLRTRNTTDTQSFCNS